MNHIIKLKSSKYYFMFVFYTAIVVTCVFVEYQIYLGIKESRANPAVDDPSILLYPTGIILVGFLFILIRWIERKLLKKELVTITDQGLENVYTFFGFMILFFMPTAKIIPWNAIKQFKITEYMGRKYVVAELNETKLPKDISLLFRLGIKINSGEKLGGFYFGSRSAILRAKELLEELNKHKPKFTYYKVKTKAFCICSWLFFIGVVK